MSTGLTGKRTDNVIQDVHDEAARALRTVTTISGVDIDVTAVTDSIKIGDGEGKFASITTVSGKDALDVNVADITVSHTDDSIRLGDGTDLVTTSEVSSKIGLDVNVINGIDANITQAPSGNTAAVFDTKAGLAIGASATVVSYTAPVSPVAYVQKIYLSATQIGTYTMKLNGNTLYRIRMSPTQFTYNLDLASGSAFGIRLMSGDIFTIEVENNGTGIGTFDATLQLMEAF